MGPSFWRKIIFLYRAEPPAADARKAGEKGLTMATCSAVGKQDGTRAQLGRSREGGRERGEKKNQRG